MDNIIKNNKLYNSLFGFNSKEKEEEYNFFFFSSKFNQTRNIILLVSVLYFLLGIFDLVYSNINFSIYIPIKLLVVTFGLILVYSNILTIPKVNIYVHLFYIVALLGITIQMQYSSDEFFCLFYTIGFVSLMSVSIMLSSVKIRYTISSSLVLVVLYLALLNYKIEGFMFFGHMFLFITVFSVVIIAALLNEISNRENYFLIKQIEHNTNDKIATEIDINKTSIIKLDKLKKSNQQLQNNINKLLDKEKSLNSILHNNSYDNETKLKIIEDTLLEVNITANIASVKETDKKVEPENNDITNKLNELKDQIEINESFEINNNRFELNQILSDIVLIFRFSAEEKSFTLKNITAEKIEINTDQAKLKQIFISLVNHLFNIGANNIECSYIIDNNNIIFKFSTDRYINDKLDFNKLLVPMYLHELGGEIIEIIEEENIIAFKIPTTQTKNIKEPNKTLNFSNKSVLIIDDDKENLSYLEHVIKNSKAQIYKATNGVEAIEIFKEKNEELQIVIMDINMPGLNGNEAAKFMKDINHAVPILLVTAYSFNKKQSFNADKVLIKPFSPKVLIENISELIN